jgi:hypothetical protein
MHILVLSKRNAQAQKRLLRAAEALAVRLELDPGLVQALKPTDKDRDVRALKEREGAAALVETLAILAGAMEPPIEETPAEESAVTVVTETEGEDPLSGVDPVDVSDVYSGARDELPPPVLEGPESDGFDNRPGLPTEPESAAEATAEETPAESAAVDELANEIKESSVEEASVGESLIEELPAEEPIEKEPEEQPAKKSTKKSSGRTSKKK